MANSFRGLAECLGSPNLATQDGRACDVRVVVQKGHLSSAAVPDRTSLDAYVDAIVDEFRGKDLTGALDLSAILLNAALGEQARRELLASRRIAFASLGVAALALVVALLTSSSDIAASRSRRGSPTSACARDRAYRPRTALASSA